MCIAWPMRLTEILPEHRGMAEYDGVRRRISLRLLPEANVGDYVLVHAGYAVELVKPEEALEQTALMRELANGMSRGDGGGSKS